MKEFDPAVLLAIAREALGIWLWIGVAASAPILTDAIYADLTVPADWTALITAAIGGAVSVCFSARCPFWRSLQSASVPRSGACRQAPDAPADDRIPQDQSW
ncbi:MAG: hypothetical protein ACOC8P_00195 [Dichotomicrobium sp.]